MQLPWNTGSWLQAAGLVHHNGTTKNLASYTYHPSGRVAGLNYGTSQACSWTKVVDPDGMARPKRIKLALNGTLYNDGGSGPFAFDGAGNLWKDGDRRYTYDGLSRLTRYAEFDEGTGLDPHERYEYDRWGNLTMIERGFGLVGPSQGTDFFFSLKDDDEDGVPDNNTIETIRDVAGRTIANLGWNGRGDLTQQDGIGPLRNKTYTWTIDDRLKATLTRRAVSPGGTPTMRQASGCSSGVGPARKLTISVMRQGRLSRSGFPFPGIRPL